MLAISWDIDHKRLAHIMLAMGAGGNLNGGVNMEGIKYYNNLINKLISEGQIIWFLICCYYVFHPNG